MVCSCEQPFCGAVCEFFYHLRAQAILGRFQGTCYSMNSGLASAGFKQKGYR